MTRTALLTIPILFAAAITAQSPAAPDLRAALAAALREPGAELPSSIPDADRAPLDRARATALASAAWQAWRDVIASGGVLDPLPSLPPTLAELAAMPDAERPPIEPHALTVGALLMPFHLVRKETTAPPETGRALFLCMHGGGQNKSAEGPHGWDVNTREWRAQTMLAMAAYPAEGLFVVPRMADDRLGRWWHAHNQEAFDRLIEAAIAAWGVDPDRVFVLGISEGGYGTDILAPFMADRFAGADAMAGGVHVADNPPENLRHVAFRTDIGANDTTYDRVGLARKFHARLDELHAAHPEDYDHVLAEQAGKGHGIDYRPGVAWIAQKRREPWPTTVTWTSRVLDHRRRSAFYWLGLDTPEHAHPIRLDARVDREGNAVDVDAREDVPAPAGEETSTRSVPLARATLRVMLRDELLDLDRPIVVRVNGAVRFEGRVERRLAHLVRTLADRGDPRYAFPAVVEVELPQDG